MVEFRRFSRSRSLAPVRMLFSVAIILAGSDLAIAAPDRPQTDKADLAWSPPPLPECTCRAQGKSFSLGTHVCLATPDGYRLAECELTQNVTNWRFSSDACVTSRATPSGKGGWREGAHLAAACFSEAGRRI